MSSPAHVQVNLPSIKNHSAFYPFMPHAIITKKETQHRGKIMIEIHQRKKVVLWFLQGFHFLRESNENMWKVTYHGYWIIFLRGQHAACDCCNLYCNYGPITQEWIPIALRTTSPLRYSAESFTLEFFIYYPTKKQLILLWTWNITRRQKPNQ